VAFCDEGYDDDGGSTLEMLVAAPGWCAVTPPSGWCRSG